MGRGASGAATAGEAQRTEAPKRATVKSRRLAPPRMTPPPVLSPDQPPILPTRRQAQSAAAARALLQGEGPGLRSARHATGQGLGHDGGDRAPGPSRSPLRVPAQRGLQPSPRTRKARFRCASTRSAPQSLCTNLVVFDAHLWGTQTRRAALQADAFVPTQWFLVHAAATKLGA